MFRKLLVLFCLTLSPMVFSAPMMTIQDNTFYAGGNLLRVDSGFEDTSDGENVAFGGVEALIGYKYRWWLGVDFRVGSSLESSDYQQGCFQVKA